MDAWRTWKTRRTGGPGQRPSNLDPTLRRHSILIPHTSRTYQESMQRIARPVGPFARHQASSSTSKRTASLVRTLYSSTHHDGQGHVHGVNEVCSAILIVLRVATNLTRVFGRTILFSQFCALGRRFETRRHTSRHLDLKPIHCFPLFPTPLQLKRRLCVMFGPFHIPYFKIFLTPSSEGLLSLNYKDHLPIDSSIVLPEG
jgi:hypothetical protein